MAEIIPTPIAFKQPLWRKYSVHVAAVILFIVLGTGGVLYLLSNQEDSSLAKIKQQIQSAQSAQQRKLVSTVLIEQQKIKGFTQLFETRKNALGPFLLLEKDTHPQVYFTRVDLSMKDKTLQLSGIANSFVILEEQMKIFKTDKNVARATLSNIGILQQGDIGFNLSLTLANAVFAYENH